MIQVEKIWEGKEPIQLYSLLTSALGGDPGPLLDRCDCGDPEIEAEAKDELGEKVRDVFQAEDNKTAVAAYLRFTAWVDKITQDYKVASDIGYQPRDHWDVVGLWFNRRRPIDRILWAVNRAMYLALKELPLPPEVYESLTSSKAEAEEMAHDEQSDRTDRAIVGRS